VVGDVAASVSALAGTGAFGYTAATFHTRHPRAAEEARHEAEMAALRAEMDTEMRVLRAQLDAEMRLLRAQGFGFGVDDDYYPGFGVDDDYLRRVLGDATRRGRGGYLGSPVRPALPSSCRPLCLKYNSSSTWSLPKSAGDVLNGP
jgi:hypothetical protein